MKKIICKIIGHKLIVAEKHLPHVRRYYVYCKRCDRYLSPPTMGPNIKINEK